MKICGLHAGHDCSFAVLNEGRPEIHLELERFIRKKEPKDDDGKKTIVVKVDESVYQMWQDWVKWCAEQTDYKSEPEAFEYLIIEAKNGQK